MARTGLDLWIGDPDCELRTMRLGFVSHPAAVLPDPTGAVDALQNAGYRLTALFGPEHGFGSVILRGSTLAGAFRRACDSLGLVFSETIEVPEPAARAMILARGLI